MAGFDDLDKTFKNVLTILPQLFNWNISNLFQFPHLNLSICQWKMDLLGKVWKLRRDY